MHPHRSVMTDTASGEVVTDVSEDEYSAQEEVGTLMSMPSAAERTYHLFLHEDEMYYQRASFFWIAESMVLVAFSLVSSHKAGILAHGRVIAFFGLVLTIVYGYAIHRAAIYVNYLNDLSKEMLPDYAFIREHRPRRGKVRRGRGRRAITIMTYALPLIVALMWIILLIGEFLP
jgi:hypothetical protein